MNKIITILILVLFFSSCSKSQVSNEQNYINTCKIGIPLSKVGLDIDSIAYIKTKPRNVLLTKNPRYRITPIHKVCDNAIIGINSYHTTWDYFMEDGNDWNGNFMPGLKALYGNYLVNISLYNHEAKLERKLFKQPVLINTLYYPAFSKDLLKGKLVNRNYIMVSVWDEDTNNDGFINYDDLRKFYYFDLNGKNKRALIPPTYSVLSSEYDYVNDLMYVYAIPDENENGEIDDQEPTVIFWVDLKNPENVGILYKSE